MNDIIILGVQLGVAVAAFLVGKYVFPNIPKSVTEKLNTLSAWAVKFVAWAKEFMKAQTGEEKMEAVVKKLKEIADEAGLKVTEDQLRAIAQSSPGCFSVSFPDSLLLTSSSKTPLRTLQRRQRKLVILIAGKNLLQVPPTHPL